MTAKMQGRERLLAKMAAIPKAQRAAMRPVLEEAAREVTSMQRRLVPVRSGALLRSIGYTFGRYRAENANVRGVSAGGDADPNLSVTLHAGDAEAYYAAFVEFGTSAHTAGGKFKGAHHPGSMARPFFYPVFRALRRRIKARITRAMRKAAREAAAR
ncbi:phage protein, HK97, GP10 [Rhodovulum sp. PH10]|uniref:HK97-gp10 family putative phage morphogenesis protein n=1 Tax=Rhodovulum sp. PH10 TaxID=1187851 RepID=UPI00027C24AE|nr:HK97-gp10 family putative phage morphogenesis protein [Rhodovulum sp. PH10]EJW12736.1 phage protein, HK97, GP10 [Rhodovulum sp. PH10]